MKFRKEFDGFREEILQFNAAKRVHSDSLSTADSTRVRDSLASTADSTTSHSIDDSPNTSAKDIDATCQGPCIGFEDMHQGAVTIEERINELCAQMQTRLMSE